MTNVWSAALDAALTFSGLVIAILGAYVPARSAARLPSRHTVLSASCPPAPMTSRPATTRPGQGPRPEAHRLLHLAAIPISCAARDLGYAWSRGRGRHQARARWHHYRAQLKAARVT
jgi:hypothetical protein